MRFILVGIILFLSSYSCAAAEKISLQLLWKHQFQFAGYYMAIEKGFYAEEGLDVVLKEFDYGVDLVDEVIQGRSQFGVARTSLLIDKNAGADVVAMFAAYQQSPLMLLTLKSSGISLSSDLAARDIMITNDAKKVGEIIAMLLQAGVTVSDFNQQRHSYSVQDLIAGNTEAMASYISNEPYQLDQLGVEYNIIHPKDYGFDMYSDILFSSRDYIEQNPEIADKFYRASIRGWMYAFEHIEETAQIIFQKYNTQAKTLDALIFEGKELRKLAFDTDGNLGTLSINKFNEMAQVYLITGSIFLGYDFSDFIYRPPSNQYRFSSAEQAFIDRSGEISVCINPDWAPYEAYREGKHSGMISDYLSTAMASVGLDYRLIPSRNWQETLKFVKSGRCQLVAGAMQTIQRSAYLNFSQPYLSIPAVLASRSEAVNQPLKTLKMGVIEQSAFHEILHDRYPGMRIIGLNHQIDGIRMLEMGQLDAFVGAEANLVELIHSHLISGIEINDRLRDSWDISFAVVKDEPYLLSILNKSIAQLTAEKHQEISQRWLKMRVMRSSDYTVLYILITGLVLFSLLGIYRYFRVLSYSKILQTAADRDALTGIFSRRKLCLELDSFTQLANRHDWKLSLIFFDVDDFKQINDSLGHAVGDRVLVEITRKINNQTRRTDRFGRWGGEEFLFVMLETDLDQAKEIAERFRSNIGHYDLGVEYPVSCSFGVAEYVENETVESWVSRADNALYKAKEAGKNCVVVNR